MDPSSAAEYLGVEEDGTGDGSPLPGFGALVALVALAVVAVGLGRRD
jgi:PGF-CTERM protein